MAENLQIRVRELPVGSLEESHFETTREPVPEPGEGEVLVRTVLLSLDAANRAWMQGVTYRDAVLAGDVMAGYALGEVVASNSERLVPGQLVLGDLGWQQYAVKRPGELQPAIDHRPLTQLHSLLGIAGKTAYHGLINVAGINTGETLLVSAAAGSVGSLVGQIGRIKGARVIGVAGGPEKCGWVVDELGFDACLDYKDTARPLQQALAEAAPDGIDVFFDNTGGPILETALFAMNLYGRVACCGAISMYDGNPQPGPAGIPGLLVIKRLRMEGFVVMDFADRDGPALADLSAWASSGALSVVEDVIDGLENAPAGLIGLLGGQNRGKRMIRVGPDPD